MKRFDDQGKELFEFDLNDEQLSIMNRRATRNRTRNSRMITEACKHVNGNVHEPLLSKEYEENARKIREVNKFMGHDRAEVLARTKAIEREGEKRALEIQPIVWRETKEEPKVMSYKSSWLGRFFDWINGDIQPTDQAESLRKNYFK